MTSTQDPTEFRTYTLPTSGLKARTLISGDLEIICSQRRRMFADVGRPDSELIPMEAAFREWLRPRLADGRYFGFLVEDTGEIIAGIGLFLLDWPPHFLHPTESQRGYILNVFTETPHRGRGIATDLMLLAEDEFRRRGLSYVVLHASPFGRPIYEKLGWESSTEMSKIL